MHIHQEIKRADLNFQNTGDIEMSVYLSDTDISRTVPRPRSRPPRAPGLMIVIVVR